MVEFDTEPEENMPLMTYQSPPLELTSKCNDVDDVSILPDSFSTISIIQQEFHDELKKWIRDSSEISSCDTNDYLKWLTVQDSQYPFYNVTYLRVLVKKTHVTHLLASQNKSFVMTKETCEEVFLPCLKSTWMQSNWKGLLSCLQPNVKLQLCASKMEGMMVLKLELTGLSSHNWLTLITHVPPAMLDVKYEKLPQELSAENLTHQMCRYSTQTTSDDFRNQLRNALESSLLESLYGVISIDNKTKQIIGPDIENKRGSVLLDLSHVILPAFAYVVNEEQEEMQQQCSLVMDMMVDDGLPSLLIFVSKPKSTAKWLAASLQEKEVPEFDASWNSLPQKGSIWIMLKDIKSLLVKDFKFNLVCIINFGNISKKVEYVEHLYKLNYEFVVFFSDKFILTPQMAEYLPQRSVKENLKVSCSLTVEFFQRHFLLMHAKPEWKATESTIRIPRTKTKKIVDSDQMEPPLKRSRTCKHKCIATPNNTSPSLASFFTWQPSNVHLIRNDPLRSLVNRFYNVMPMAFQMELHAGGEHYCNDGAMILTWTKQPLSNVLQLDPLEFLISCDATCRICTMESVNPVYFSSCNHVFCESCLGIYYLMVQRDCCPVTECESKECHRAKVKEQKKQESNIDYFGSPLFVCPKSSFSPAWDCSGKFQKIKELAAQYKERLLVITHLTRVATWYNKASIRTNVFPFEYPPDLTEYQVVINDFKDAAQLSQMLEQFPNADILLFECCMDHILFFEWKHKLPLTDKTTVFRMESPVLDNVRKVLCAVEKQNSILQCVAPETSDVWRRGNSIQPALEWKENRLAISWGKQSVDVQVPNVFQCNGQSFVWNDDLKRYLFLCFLFFFQVFTCCFFVGCCFLIMPVFIFPTPFTTDCVMVRMHIVQAILIQMAQQKLQFHLM